MFVDASVIIAILTAEPDAEALARLIDRARAQQMVTSVLAVWEATVGLYRKKRISMGEAEARVQEFMDFLDMQVLPITPHELPMALQAFERYGRHRYPDSDRNRALNLADCFHYATAKSHFVPMFSTDAGFALTDVATVGTEST